MLSFARFSTLGWAGSTLALLTTAPPVLAQAAPGPQVQAPQVQAQAPQGQYQAPQGQYQAPQGQYQAPQGQYQVQQGQVQAPQGQAQAQWSAPGPGGYAPANAGLQQVVPQQVVPQQVQLGTEPAQNVLEAQQQVLGGGAVNPMAPFPPLSPEWSAYLDQVLTKWEVESAKIEKFQCQFVRQQFEPALVEKHASSEAKGELKYMKPDKGLFKVTELLSYKGLDGQGNPQYGTNPQQQFGEYWICDGQYIHMLDQNEKKCTKRELPPQMRGNAIHLSPLPFVFGVKKADLEARYWIKPLPEQPGESNFRRLEVYPRRADDASNYQRLEVIIDLRDWLPAAMFVFLPNWRPDAEHREVYYFTNRVVNAKNLLPAMFQKEFIPADPPRDWKVIIEPYLPDGEDQLKQPRVATPPAAQPTIK